MNRAVLWSVMALVALFLNISDRPLGEEERDRGPAGDWFFRQRAYPLGSIDMNLRKETIRQAHAAVMARKQQAAGAVWHQAGPSNVGGRLTALAISRQNTSLLYAGAADGGVLKSTDAGAHWTPLFDDQISLSIGALAVDPTDDQILYVGTGEANSSGDSYDGFGLLKTTDGGTHWTALGLEQTRHIGKIVIDPLHPSTVYVAAMGALFTTNPDRGVYKSTDAGATWSRVLSINDSTGVVDIAINPSHPDTLLAAAWERRRGPQGRLYVGGVSTGIYRSTDAGSHWSLLSGGLPAPSATVGRPGVAIASSNPLICYACFADDPGNFSGVFVSSDAGTTWTRTSDAALLSLYSNFGWYFGTIAVSPADPQRVFVLGVAIGKTTDGGASWAMDWGPPHVDHHALVFDPANPTVMYSGNDGGLAKSTDGGASWFRQTDQDLYVTQFYAGCIDAAHPALTMGGTQDNGTPRTTTGSPSDWRDINGGDGFYCAIDYTNNNFQYAEYQYGGLTRTTDNWTSSNYATSGIDPTDRTNWSTPLIMDPSNPRVLYTGTSRIYRTSDRAQSWMPISNDLTNGLVVGYTAYATVTTIDVAPTDSNTILAGTDDANVWITTNRGAAWTSIRSGLPNRWITRVRFDPTDRTIAYVTLSGYRLDSKLPHVFRTSNLGSTWKDISGNLPEAPVNVICVDPGHTERLYVGTDVGAWFTTDTGATWSPMGSGVPNVVIDDMVLHGGARIARAFTHGRSVWEINLDDLVQSVATDRPARPAAFELEQNYPNPFNPTTVVSFQLSVASNVRLVVYDVLGREVATLVNEVKAPGEYSVRWDASGLASGVYFCRLTARQTGAQSGQSADLVQTRKLVLLR